MFIETATMDEETALRVRELGSINISGSGLESLPQDTVQEILSRFARGDYGDVSSERCWANDKAMYLRNDKAYGLYTLEDGTKVTVLVEFCQVVTSIEIHEPEFELEVV